MFANRVFVALVFGFVAALGASSVQAQDYTWSQPSLGTTMRYYSNPNPVLKLCLHRNTPGTDTLTSLGGTATAPLGFYFYTTTVTLAEVDKLRLWHDANNSSKVDSGDVELATLPLNATTWAARRVYFNGFSLPCGGADVNLLITLDLKPDHPLGLYFSLRLSNVVGLWQFVDASTSSGPTLSLGPRVTTVSNAANLTLEPSFNVPSAGAMQGTIGHPIMQFRLTRDYSGTTPKMKSLYIWPDVSKGHTALPADVTQLRLYREGSANGVADQSDTFVGNGVLIGSAGSPSGFVYVFNYDVDITSPTFLVVADISPSAVVGRKVKTTVYAGGSNIVTDGAFLNTGTAVSDDPQTICIAPTGGYLAFTAQPHDTEAGVNMNAPEGLKVEARRADNSVDTTYAGPVSILIETGSGTFTQASANCVQAIAGVATLANVAITLAGNYTLRAIAQPFAPVVSDSFAISHGPAYRLTITTQPQDGVVGVALPPPVVQAQDLYGNVVASFNSPVTAGFVSNPPGGTLTNNQVFASSGTATFDNLGIDKAGAGYSLIFFASGLVASGASSFFSMAVGAPAHLVVLVEPRDVTGGALMVPFPRVQVQDAGSNAVTAFDGAMTVAIGNNPSAGTLSGTLSVQVIGAVAQFSDLSVNHAGAGYTLVFSVNAGAATGVSAPFDVGVGAAVKLAVVTQPSDTTGGMVFDPSVVVEVQDAGGNVINDYATTITAAITAGTGEAGSVLWGTTVLTTVMGVAAYTDLAVTKASPTPYTLTFTANADLAPGVSNKFIISVGVSARVGVVIQPGLASMGAALVQQPVVEIQDLGGNAIVDSTALITVSLDPVSPQGSTLQGTATVAAVAGVATYAGLQIDLPGVGFVMRFSSGVLIDGVSEPFNVASTATHVAVVTEPGLGVIGVPLSVQPVIEVRDDAGVVVSIDSFSYVTAEIISGTGAPTAVLSGQISAPVINGRATFNSLAVSAPGLGYHLKFTCYPSLIPASSAAFNVAGVAIRAVVIRQPAGGEAGEPLLVQPKVTIVDSNNVLVVNDNVTVVTAYITPATGSAHATLGGSVTLTAVNGVVDFTDLSVDRPGAGFTLSFSSLPMLQSFSTTAFEIDGEVAPANGSSSAIVAGVDGGSCSQGHHTAPWMLLALLMLAIGGSAMCRACR
ncbi:MAG: hypothetical protein IT462_14895 [Planctomycetes bacterium]|nr:hypothetical protein [Planctomycetota bacterium]